MASMSSWYGHTMKLLISRKRHESIVQELNEQIQRYSSLYEMADNDARGWRQRFELSQLTPEVKADTEAAFTRGEQNAKAKISATLMQLAIDLRVGTD